MESLKNAKAKFAAANKDVLELIKSFIDERSFVETDAFMCSDTELSEAIGEGVVSGFASVDGVGTCIFATNPAVLKGSIGALNAKKIVRAVNNAVRMDKPLIAVWDTSGARFAEGVECLEGYGSILRAFTIAYGEIPIISIIKGNDLGLSSYAAGISDFVLCLDGGVCATASPLVISAKTGEKQDKIGSCETLLARGIATNRVKKDLRAALCRIFAIFGNNPVSKDDDNRVCKGLKPGVTADAVIAEVFDKNSFFGIRELFAPEVKTGFATLGGITVGVAATDSHADGRLTADGCIKISEFLNVCENAECPVVFLTDCVGTEIAADDTRLIREMSNLVYRINSLNLDSFAVVYGKAIGAAYTAFVSSCEYKIAWDSAAVGVLESESAARLLYVDEIKTAKDKDKAAKKLATEYEGENCSALKVARQGIFDNVIEPNLTRSYLMAALLAHVE